MRARVALGRQRRASGGCRAVFGNSVRNDLWGDDAGRCVPYRWRVPCDGRKAETLLRLGGADVYFPAHAGGGGSDSYTPALGHGGGICNGGNSGVPGNHHWCLRGSGSCGTLYALIRRGHGCAGGGIRRRLPGGNS